MSDIIKYENFEKKLIEINNQKVLVANDVADLYGIKVEALNQAVKRNEDLFPNESYKIELTKEEKNELITNCDRFNKLKHSSKLPYAYTEKGLMMIGTILTSQEAKKVHLYIVETFSKIRQISKNLKAITIIDNPEEQKELIKASNELLNEVIEADIVEEKKLDSNVKKVTDEFEINLGVIKFKRTIENKD